MCLLAFLPGVGGGENKIHEIGEACPELVERIRGVKIGKISTKNQPKTLIPKSKNQIFHNFFNCFADIELRESQTDI